MATGHTTMALGSEPDAIQPKAPVDPTPRAQVERNSSDDQEPNTVQVDNQETNPDSDGSIPADGKQERADQGGSTGQPTTNKQTSPDEQYPVERILDYRRTGLQVDLLVQWGEPWLEHEPTWEAEEELWLTARRLVQQFWKPNGRNNRTRLLQLDPVEGPFTVSCILAERRTKGRGDQHTETQYLVDFVGYERPVWTASTCVTQEAIQEFKDSNE